MLSDRKTPLARLLALLVLACLCLTSGSAFAREASQDQAAAVPFKVLAFYSGTWDAAHIDFQKEARERFPQFGTQNGFTYEQTNNWDRLNSLTAAQAQVVMFLDDSPHSSAQQAGFQRYMENGGGFFGFHVAAYNDAGEQLAVVQPDLPGHRPVRHQHLAADRGHVEGGEPFPPVAGEHWRDLPLVGQ